MIIENKKSELKTVGDISRNKVSIDVNNLNFITTLLSSNLYSNPLESFYRETVSNAWDSHVEAHKEDTPVIINISDSAISIRDYGVGLSPERFKEIYLNIGSSTKRADNTQIGGFGIGRFSALACSDVVTIKSYYNGKLYTYLMIKEGNSVNIDLINTTDTDQINGVEVSIPNKYTDTKNFEALRYLVFFPNIYITSNTSNDWMLNSINELKIKHYNTFAVSSGRPGYTALLGNVLYPLSTSFIHRKDMISMFLSNGIALKFNIGELEVTPNRESIIYSNKTIDIIQKRSEEAYDEIMSIFKSTYDKPYDNLIDMLSIFEYRNYIYLTLLDIPGKSKCIYTLNSREITDYYNNKNTEVLKCGDKYYGKYISDYLGIYDDMSNFNHLNISYLYCDCTFNKSENKIRHSRYSKMSNFTWIELITDSKVGKYAKEYIESFDIQGAFPICLKYTKQEFIDKYTNELLKFFTGKDNIIKEIVEAFYYKLQSTKFTIDLTSQAFKDFKESRKAEVKKLRESSKSEKTSAHISVEWYKPENYCVEYDGNKVFNNVEDYVEWANNNLKAGTIITNKRDENKHKYEILHHNLNMNLLLVNKDNLKYNELIRTYVPTDKLLSTANPIMNRIHTYFKSDFKFLNFIKDYYYLIPDNDKKCIKYVEESYEMVLSFGYSVNSIIKEDSKIPDDEYLIHCIKIASKYIDKINEFNILTEGAYNSNYVLHTLNSYFIMKHKIFRISNSAYIKMKNTPLFKNI